MKYLKTTFSIIFLSVFLTACMPGSGHYSGNKPAGFLSGLWHGWISPISLLLGLFNPDIRIYEIHNSGWWYDFGFFIAIMSGFGGIAFRRRKNT